MRNSTLKPVEILAVLLSFLAWGCGKSDSGGGATNCNASQTECNGSCVDFEIDPDNCGDCGNDCDVAGGEVCLNGSCETGCGSLTDCSGSCVDTQSDPNNCGDCGNDCDVGGGEVCLSGSCGTDCGSLTDCSGSCVDTQTDLENCGGCGDTCQVENGTAGCDAGDCTVAGCNQPFADCDGDADNGCEADTRTDSDNCGTCGNACDTTTGACKASECLTGRICVHAGEMAEPGSYGPGPVYATLCGVCTLNDFSLCPRFFVCDYVAPQCGGCISGLADGGYTIGVFIDTNSNADPQDPLPDSGDAIASSCNVEILTNGGTVGTNIVVTDIVP